MASKQNGNIYLLRHEQRSKSITFDTPLTENGLKNASTILNNTLANLNIDVIYCSPFLRTIQTIAPFCFNNNVKINLEWSLAESIPSDYFIPVEYANIVNTNYTSVLPYDKSLNNDIPCITHSLKDIQHSSSDRLNFNLSNDVTNFDILINQAETFLNTLDYSKNILLVTHLPVINAFLSHKGNKYIGMYTHHETGSITLLT